MGPFARGKSFHTAVESSSLKLGVKEGIKIIFRHEAQIEDPANEQLLEIRILLILPPAHSMHSMHSNEEKDIPQFPKLHCFA